MSRLVLRFALGVLFVLVTTFVVVAHGARSAAQKHFQRHVGALLTDVAIARGRLSQTPPERAEEVVRALRRELHHPVALLDPSRAALPEAVREGLRKGEPRTTHRKGQGWALYVPVHLAGAKTPHLLKVGPAGPVRLQDHGHVWLVVLALLGIVVGTSVVLAWPLVRRLRRLERVADRISAGDLDARAEGASRDAIGRLAARFNAMADRVQELLEQQRGLLQAVSHELRTPVARLRFGLEMLGDSPDPEDRARRLGALTEDLDELETLVAEILLYIRTGDEALELHLEDVELAAVAQALAGRHGELRPGVAIRIDLAGAQEHEPQSVPRTLRADPRLLARALGNALDNALRHARAEVVISARVRGAGLDLRVDDDGPGIPAEERERIFEPFVRLDRSRSRETGGTGLGLSLVRRILRSHGGDARAEASPLGGARLVLSFPRFAVPPPASGRDASRGAPATPDGSPPPSGS